RGRGGYHVRFRVLARSAAAVPLYSGRNEQKSADPEPADARGARLLRRSWRARRRAVLPHPQHCDRFEGQCLSGGVVWQARAPVELYGHGGIAMITLPPFLIAAAIASA